MQIQVAHTSPLNAPGATPKLTRSQVWEGLKLKAREPMSFVPMIQSCEVLKESATELTRKVIFKDIPGPQPKGEVTEVVKFVEGVRVRRAFLGAVFLYPLIVIHSCGLQADFEMLGLGTSVANIISSGDGESDLYLTFIFSQTFPDTPEGKAAAAAQSQVATGASSVVKHSVDQIRALVKEGKLGA